MPAKSRSQRRAMAIAKHKPSKLYKRSGKENQIPRMKFGVKIRNQLGLKVCRLVTLED